MYKKIKTFCIAAFFAIIVSACAAQESEAEITEEVQSDNIVQIQETFTADVEDANNLLTAEQNKLLKEFALRCSQTLKTMQFTEIEDLFADKSEDYYINVTAYKTLASIRGLNKKDLTLENADIIYRIDSVTDYGNQVVVEVFEDNIQKFRHLQENSYTYNTYHKFVLISTDSGWRIKTHIQEEDFFLLAAEAWGHTSGEYAERSETALQLLIADAEENFVLAKENLNDFKEVTVTKEYDREKAVEYAKQWCNKRNPQYLEYDLYGGNCQNFASQCIHAGGMDMDIKGTYTCQWKFYGKDLNYSQAASGRSYSWIGVDEFYSYVTYNTTSGLITQHDIDIEYAQKGDIIHVGAYYKWHHALVVTDVMKDENGKVEEVLLASNTADRWNYPLSAYIYTYPRLIHIEGQI